MNATRIACLALVAIPATSAFSSTGTPVAPSDYDITYASATTKKQAGPALAVGAAIFAKPRIGLRVGGGPWNDFMLNGGVDVTFNVPFLPLPAIRLDAEVWGQASDLGGNRHGNALSLLGIQTFLFGYAGLGPTYYYADDQGDHKSGFGVKGLIGFNLPSSMFAEAGIIIGPSTPPIFVTIGTRF